MKKLLIAVLALLFLLPTTLVASATEDTMTDEELYAEIDRKLRADRMRGQILFGMDKNLTVEEWKAALTEIGIPTDFDCEYLYLSGQATNPDARTYGNFIVMVPEEIIREILFRMNRSDAIKSASVNGLDYPTWILPSVGDVNGDFEFNAKDYMIVKRAVLGAVEVDDDLADVNYDGDVDAKDYMLIKSAILGKSKLSGRPAPADMTEKQLNHWLDELEVHVKDSNERILFLNEGVTAEEAKAAIGGTFETLYCSEEHYPDYALWLVIDISRENFRETIKNIALCDLVDAWNWW